MSYANGTPFLNLPQTVGTDKRDWVDTNAAFLDLDGKLKSAYDGAIDTASALAALTEVVSGISSDVSDLQTTVGNHTTSIATINEALTLINTALTTLNTTVNGKFDSAGIADPYDAEHGIYAIDDVVTYNGQRYVCHVAVTAAEPFDADKWTAVDIQTELDQVHTELANKTFNYSSKLDDTVANADNDKTFSDLDIDNDKMYKLILTVSGTEVALILVGTTSTYLTIGNANTTYYACISVTLNTTAKTLRIYNKVLGSGWSTENIAVKLFEVK